LREIEEGMYQAPIVCETGKFLYGVEEFKGEYCDSLMRHLANGASVKSFLSVIGVTQKVFDRWLSQFPDFKVAYEIGESMGLGHFEKLAKMQALGVIKGNNSMLWNLMKNRYPQEFKDKVELEHNGEVTFKFDTGIKRELDEDLDSEDFKEVPDRPSSSSVVIECRDSELL
jgi:hypothetical protein